MRGIEIRNEMAPHKCKACRNYDRDRWRRDKPPLPVPVPRPSPPNSQFGSATLDDDSDNDDEEAAGFGGRCVRIAMGLDDDILDGGEQVAQNGGARLGERKTRASVTHAEGAVHHLPGVRVGRPERSNSRRPGVKLRERQAIAAELEDLERDLAAFAAASENEDRSPRRTRDFKERWGGFGGRKLRGAQTTRAMGGIPMEREPTRSRSASRRSSYRGADMTMGGGAGPAADLPWGGEGDADGGAQRGRQGMGLGLDGETTQVGESLGQGEGKLDEHVDIGLGFGFEAFDMESGGSSSDTDEASRPGGQRSDTASSGIPATHAGEDTLDGTGRGVTKESVECVDSSEPARGSQDVSPGASVVVSVAEVPDDEDDAENDAQGSVTSNIMVHF